MLSKILFASTALIVGNSCTKEVKVKRAKKISYKDVDEYENYSYGEYTTTIFIGTPPQEIDNVVLDSGSYMPWVKVDGWCSKTSCPGVTPKYNPKKSSSFSI
jgi:hypothetical protein